MGRGSAESEQEGERDGKRDIFVEHRGVGNGAEVDHGQQGQRNVEPGVDE